MDSVSAHQKGMPMASHRRNQWVAHCIVGLADSARFSDNRLAAACFAEALAVAAGSAALLAVAGPILVAALLIAVKFLDSSRPPIAGFPLPGCDKPARCARETPA